MTPTKEQVERAKNVYRQMFIAFQTDGKDGIEEIAQALADEREKALREAAGIADAQALVCGCGKEIEAEILSLLPSEGSKEKGGG